MRTRKQSAESGEDRGDRGDEDPLDRGAVFQELAAAAQRFVNNTPRYRRTAEDRQHLLDALTRAQLVLSVQERRQARRRPGRPTGARPDASQA